MRAFMQSLYCVHLDGGGGGGGGSSSTNDNNNKKGVDPVFYGVMSVVGLIVVFILIAAIIYHCFVLKKWMAKNREENEEK